MDQCPLKTLHIKTKKQGIRVFFLRIKCHHILVLGTRYGINNTPSQALRKPLILAKLKTFCISFIRTNLASIGSIYFYIYIFRSETNTTLILLICIPLGKFMPSKNLETGGFLLWHLFATKLLGPTGKVHLPFSTFPQIPDLQGRARHAGAPNEWQQWNWGVNLGVCRSPL
jgi:hypothetical protein